MTNEHIIKLTKNKLFVFGMIIVWLAIALKMEVADSFLSFFKDEESWFTVPDYVNMILLLLHSLSMAMLIICFVAYLFDRIQEGSRWHSKLVLASLIGFVAYPAFLTVMNNTPINFVSEDEILRLASTTKSQYKEDVALLSICRELSDKAHFECMKETLPKLQTIAHSVSTAQSLVDSGASLNCELFNSALPKNNQNLYEDLGKIEDIFSEYSIFHSAAYDEDMDYKLLFLKYKWHVTNLSYLKMECS
jgi:hypothetical protein